MFILISKVNKMAKNEKLKELVSDEFKKNQRDEEKNENRMMLYLLPASFFVILAMLWNNNKKKKSQNNEDRQTSNRALRLAELMERQARSGKLLVAELENIDIGGVATVTLKKEHLSLFKTIQQTSPFEIGGYIDFDHVSRDTDPKGLKRVLYYYGDSGSVDFPTLDYEIEFHTHPFDKRQYTSPPSGADLEAIVDNAIKNGTQVAVVFAHEAIYVYSPRESFLQQYIGSNKRDRKALMKTVIDFTDAAYKITESEEDISYFSRAMDQSGFNFKIFEYGKDITFNVNIMNI